MRRAFVPLAPAQLTIVIDGSDVISYLDGIGAYSDQTAHPRPQLLILDIKMPEVTGLEVLAWVRSHGKFAALPIVMLTSSSQLTDIDFSRKNGANAYLVKPSQSRELVEVMKRLIAAVDAQQTSGDPLLAMPENLLIEQSAKKS
ncbi:response regulator [Rariglobus hedericola]|nr:response regulator [Rariglobus hedericola]